MDKSILLAFFYVLQNSGFHLTCDQAFFFWGGGGGGGGEIRWTGKRETRVATFTFLSLLASQEKRKKKCLITG